MKLSSEQLLQRGVDAHMAGNLEEAEEIYCTILEAEPWHPDANHNLGVMAVSVNKAELSLPLFKAALKSNPKIKQFWLSYIDALIKENQLEVAKEALEQAKKEGLVGEAFDSLSAQLTPAVDSKEPSEAEINNLLQSYENGLLVEAEKLALSFTQRFPEHHFGWKALGAVFKETGRTNESLFPNQKAVQLMPQDAVAYSNLGVTLFELGRFVEAEVALKQSIELKPDYAEAHTNLGNTLKELGRYDEALSSYRQSIARKPGQTEVHYNLGELLFEGNEYDLAAEQFELAGGDRSKLYAVKCAFQQDQETIFYEKFDLLVSQVETNAVIGSLALRSELKYGVKRPNPFCSDPLKYVVNNDLNEQYDFENIFIKPARDVLADNSVSQKEQGHLKNGVQTSGNIFIQGRVPKTEIESIVRAEIEKYRVHFKDSEEGFIKSWPTSYEIRGWLVCIQSGGKLAPHIHDSGWIAGSICINAPVKSKVDSGNLVLCLSDQEHVSGEGKSQQKTIDVSTGSLCLFPSSLHHYTVPFEEKEDRIVLEFEVIPKG